MSASRESRSEPSILNRNSIEDRPPWAMAVCEFSSDAQLTISSGEGVEFGSEALAKTLGHEELGFLSEHDAPIAFDVVSFVDDRISEDQKVAERKLHLQVADIIEATRDPAITTANGVQIPAIQIAGEAVTLHYPAYRRAVTRNHVYTSNEFRSFSLLACSVVECDPSIVEDTAAAVKDDPGKFPEDLHDRYLRLLLYVLGKPKEPVGATASERLNNQLQALSLISERPVVLDLLSKEQNIHYTVVGRRYVVIQEQHPHGHTKKQWLLASEELAGLLANHAFEVVRNCGVPMPPISADKAFELLYDGKTARAIQTATEQEDGQVNLHEWRDENESRASIVEQMLAQLAITDSVDNGRLTDAGREWFSSLPTALAAAPSPV